MKGLAGDITIALKTGSWGLLSCPQPELELNPAPRKLLGLESGLVNLLRSILTAQATMLLSNN